MIYLDETDRKLQVVLDEAHATNPCDVTVSYGDITIATGSLLELQTQLAQSDGTTPVDILSSPAAGVRRTAKMLVVYNADTIAHAITVRYNDGGTIRIMTKQNVAEGETLVYVDGKGWEILPAVSLSGRLIRAPQVLTSGTSYTTPAGCHAIWARLFGAGGGGGGTTTAGSSAACAGGGGAGAYAEKYFDVDPDTAYTYAIGAGGAGGNTSGGNGGTGGSTTLTVGATTVTSPGGNGGTGQTAGTSASYIAGGAATAQATNGDVNGVGAPGEFGARDSGTIGRSGGGAANNIGGGPAGLVAAGAGTNGIGFGVGGSGGLVLNASAAVAGGAGGPGLIVIHEYT